MPLTAKKLTKLLKKPGRHHDAHGLILQVVGPNNASWLLRYQRNGRERWAGLGPAWLVTLAEARVRAKAMRLQLLDGIDPLEAKRAAKTAAKLADVRKLSFAEAARAYHKQHEPKWRSAQHAQQWLRSLTVFAFPIIGGMDVAVIETPDILRVIEPIWQTKTTTADRIRNRCEAVLDWCTVRGHRPKGDNPARWTGHLDQVLPALAKPVHFAALPYDQLPAFMSNLRAQEGVAARALEFLILAAARSGEALGAVWSEIDLANSVWVVPASRMKAHKEHRVPLSDPALDLLRHLPREDNNPRLFIGARAGAGLSDAALSRVLKRIGNGTTTHGFRSTFSDWAHEHTAFDSHSIEISLAHAVGTEVAKAYQRGDLIAKRRQLMAAWGRYCTSEPVAAGDNIVPLGGAQ